MSEMKLGVNDLKTVRKVLWNKRVKSYVKELNRKDLLEDIKKHKKPDYNELAKEEFKHKDYFENLNLEDGRMK